MIIHVKRTPNKWYLQNVPYDPVKMSRNYHFYTRGFTLSETENTHRQAQFFVLLTARMLSKVNKRKWSALLFLSQWQYCSKPIQCCRDPAALFYHTVIRDERTASVSPFNIQIGMHLFSQRPFIIVLFCVTLREVICSSILLLRLTRCIVLKG